MFIATILREHRAIWRQKSFLMSFVIGCLFLFLSLYLNYEAGLFADAHKSLPVTDLILSNIGPLNVDFWYIQGFALFLLFLLGVAVTHPKHVPFGLKSLALLILIRSFFISLTHIAPFPIQQPFVQSDIAHLFNFNADLFFSGHTATPYLMSLLFWSSRKLRFIFLGLSVFFGAVVLLGHYHYSIDVFAAFFITHSVFHLACLFFPKDFQRLREEGPQPITCA